MILVSATFAAEPASPAPSRPSRVRLALGGSYVRDLADADPSYGTGATAFGGGPGLALRVDWTPQPGLAVRFALSGSLAAGNDELTWEADGQRWYSDDHAATYLAARLGAGPEVELLPAAAVRPYLGALVGFGPVVNTHALDEATSALADETDEGIDPYTLQWVPAAGGCVGLRLGRKLAFEVEAGYDISFLPEAPLQKAPSQLDAARSPWWLDVVRVSAGVALPL